MFSAFDLTVRTQFRAFHVAPIVFLFSFTYNLGVQEKYEVNLWEGHNMSWNNHQVTLTRWFAQFVTYTLGAILLICANTNSCCMFHQLEAPTDLGKFSKIR